MNMERKEPLRNVIPAPKAADDIKYETMPDGMHVYGLVAVKQCMKRNFKKDGEDPAYKLSFRSKENPRAFVNATFKASVHKKSGLFKALVLMSGGKFKEVPGTGGGDPAEGFEILTKSVGHWFNLMIEYKEYADKAYNNIINNSIIPNTHMDEKVGDCILWFKGQPGEASKSPAATPTNTASGFEGMPDVVSGGGVVDLTGPEDDSDIPF